MKPNVLRKYFLDSLVTFRAFLTDWLALKFQKISNEDEDITIPKKMSGFLQCVCR